MASTASINSSGNKPSTVRHKILQSHPLVWASVGVLQTLLTSGIVFGWASLLPVLRAEKVLLSPQQFTQIFTFGAIGNYVSTLIFGAVLDRYGPRLTAIVASLLFTVGLGCLIQPSSFIYLATGIGLLGFAGPGIQLPTLHMANLFPNSRAAAVFMSAQAAAFDGGTAVWAVLRWSNQAYGVTSQQFLQWYMVVPLSVLVTAVCVWPDTIVGETSTSVPANKQYVGAGSPYLSPAIRGATVAAEGGTSALRNAPLSVVLRHGAFYSLAIWVSIHILKLNFIVATINDQLLVQEDGDAAEQLIDVFGAMLPFGCVVLPLVAYVLDRSALYSFQLANAVGFLYGGILVWFPSNKILQTCLVFPAVATSRQMVYSTVFHQVGQVFGFANYGVLLGLTNVVVSLVSMVQSPLVAWAEASESYFDANMVLWIATLPLFWIVLGSSNHTAAPHTTKPGAAERTPLLSRNRIVQRVSEDSMSGFRRPRSNSAAQVLQA